MKRAYTNNGLGMSTKIKNKNSGKSYLISTATDGDLPVWQLAVFAFVDDNADANAPLLFDRTYSFDDAEKLHIATEKLVAECPESDWVQTSIPMINGKKTSNTSNVVNHERFYEYCRARKFDDKDIEKIIKLAEINGGEITDGMLRGYLPIAWAGCVRIAEEMQSCGIAMYVKKFSQPVVHLPQKERDGWWKSTELLDK